ncbi:MAG: hypothetical protein QNK37_21325 [Acidobacteriota bacterium]|nr:hypothetical protein [Acidobacteriota bacterium]
MLFAQGLAPYPNGQGQFPGGSWVNFEYPHCKPIAVARLGKVSEPSYYLLVCNTADNTLEIFDISGAGMPVAVDRVRVGLDPVSVYWHEVINADENYEGTIYTANMAGDSVSMISFRGPAPTANLLRTENVGDEPVDLVYWENGGNPVLYVTLHSRHAGTSLDATTLAQLSPDPHIPIPGFVNFKRSPGSAFEPVQAIIDSPRTIDIVDTTHPLGGMQKFAFVLGGVGTHHDYPNDPASTSNTNSFFETELGFDLYFLQFTGAGGITGVHQKLGTRNFNMAFDSSGAALVVSGDAANRKQKTKATVMSEPTGFLRTLLHVMPTPAVAGSTVLSRDLNRQTVPTGIGAPVAVADSLSHATDVAIYETDAHYKVYVTALNNNGLGVLTDVKPGGVFNTNANSWGRRFVNLDKGPGTFAGPSSLAIKYDPGSDGGDRIYVLNRFHNSVDIISPYSDTVIGNFSLQNDPEPEYIKAGREFLYGVRHGNGFNSCESCHTSGRLDKLRWDLSDPVSTSPFSLQLISALEDPNWNDPQFNNSFAFSAPKGEFITQSLQGLVNFEVKEDFAQDTWFSNRPYHWDMDQAHFSDFNGGGFQDLLGGSGLSTIEMQTMIRFINSIHYPPNKEQAADRRYRGDIGDAGTLVNPNFTYNGTQAQLGLKIYHMFGFPGIQGRSCVQCHSLPEGSNNLGTENFGRTILDDTVSTAFLNNLPPVIHQGTSQALGLPMETAAIRGLAQKESIHMGYAVGNANRYKAHDMIINDYTTGPIFDPAYLPTTLHLDFPLFNNEYAVSNALFHNGASESINDFIALFFQILTQPGMDAVTQFVREFDTGVAPAIGDVHTITAAGGNTAGVLNLLEQVRVVNVGVAVTGHRGGARVGYYYEPSTTSGVLGNFINVSTGATVPAMTLINAPVNRDVLVFQATPLGMERRIAVPGVNPVMLTGPTPANIQLETMVPNTAYEDVPGMSNNWDLATATTPPALPFVWGSTANEPWDLKATRLLQAGYLPPTTVKPHEAPRRFRVSGANIRAGAVLRLWIPKSLPDPGFGDWYVMEAPIYPSDKVNSQGNRIWETAVEADPMMSAVFAVGGYWSQGVHPGKLNSVLNRSAVLNINETGFNPAAHFNVAAWNSYIIEVINEDGTSASATGQVLNIEPPGFTH